ncbi:hypothetical protein VIN01S_29230 [Vibrio inusitatus NBRC 102082]|uniref:Porin n=1 Tax=Vibrio inusitatus NBRC 102082 TaxID=1219070 RepID=A0A4Y3HY69_9VIBR|nr:oligogalacturonate-specific porin KdgM family protein [Vibrio inusitatus]GEA52119.1 hypothetical protein VIN01S_29230 [Vibrio inusitatus NBRC 102082]
MKKLLLTLPAVCMFAPITTVAATEGVVQDNYSKVQLVTRTQYRTASDQFLQMFRIAGVVTEQDSMLRGMYWSIETNASMGNDFSEFKSSYNEAEFNKGFYFGKNAIKPGAVFSWNSSGLRVDPYVEFDRRWTKDFSTAIRARYNINTYDSTDIYGETDRDRTQRYDLYISYNLTDSVNIKYNPTYYVKTDNYHNRNGENDILEHNVTVQYDATERFKPFIELGDLGYNERFDDTEYQIRLGFRYQLAN